MGETQKKTLLIIGGGIETVPGICLARQMGLHVVVSDMNPKAPGFAEADDHLMASTYDVEATVAEALRFHRQSRAIDGVMCIATDVPLTVAAVAQALGLPGISMESAHLAMDKLAMKDRFSRDGVPVPWYQSVDSAQQLCEVAREQGFPLVVKPVDSRGARGVLRLGPGDDLEQAYACARSHSPTGRVMVERFLSGPQISTESLVVEGEVFTPGFSDRNYELLERFAPHIIENGGTLPSFLSAEIQQAVRDLVAEAARSLGIRNGVVKGDILVHEGRPFVIELAARLSGGYFCTHQIPLNTGVDLVGAAIRQALGESPDGTALIPRYQKGVAQRFIFPEPGVVTAVEGAQEVAAWPGIALCEMRVALGDRIGAVDSHPARAGLVIATGTDREEAAALACRAVAAIRVETRPCGK